MAKKLVSKNKVNTAFFIWHDILLCVKENTESNIIIQTYLMFSLMSGDRNNSRGVELEIIHCKMYTL
jgi:hypothetical protein